MASSSSLHVYWFHWLTVLPFLLLLLPFVFLPILASAALEQPQCSNRGCLRPRTETISSRERKCHGKYIELPPSLPLQCPRPRSNRWPGCWQICPATSRRPHLSTRSTLSSGIKMASGNHCTGKMGMKEGGGSEFNLLFLFAQFWFEGTKPGLARQNLGLGWSQSASKWKGGRY